MNRRTFIGGVVGSLIAWSSAAVGQQVRKLARVGVLSPGSTGSGAFVAFEEELRALGWFEGRNLLIDRRYAEGRAEQYGVLAAELVRLNVDVIVPAGGPASLQAAREATKTIPIVMVASSRNPIGEGLIKSFAHPGGNITGLATAPAELGGKQLELLKEAVPAVSRVGILWDATTGPYRATKEIDTSARFRRVEILPFEVRERADFERVIADATKARVGGLVVVGSPMFVRYRSDIADLLIKQRLPAIGLWRSQADAGALMAYGPSLTNEFRSAAIYVDKILKGANPGDLPVEEPTKYELVINLKTAKALGLTIPQSLLLRADEVIQ
jgi:putative ABC transport system substrate-binding protein